MAEMYLCENCGMDVRPTLLGECPTCHAQVCDAGEDEDEDEDEEDGPEIPPKGRG